LPLNDETRALLDRLAELEVLRFGEVRIGELRRRESLELRFMDPPAEVGSVEYELITSSVGAIPMRLYRPRTRPPHPVLFFIHGGGWALGDIGLYDGLARRLCRVTERAVLSVDYHKAPEHPFPAGLEDCYAALGWLAGRPADAQLDVARVAVIGESAGGNLAAALALTARDRGGPALAAQVLVCPVLDPDCRTDSHRTFSSGYRLDSGAVRQAWTLYLAGAPADGRAAPPRGKLHGLPPALIVTAEYDVLRDEAEDYARLLRNSGIETKLERVPGTVHGFWSMALQAAANTDQLIARFLIHHTA
jgi:acetyl esterase